ncbi:SDR family NAD(P)-dependent oxidoreductase [Acholeplasma granularum]|uniref:SDR family NAD(P)-dependent oxidoreductase n=1 Tax=Acholeplasma granularum TaxID=264635 RepID=UPI00046F619E|nr:SDR family NAD(P)-dependent oxidoreductase [Acholeplasma granularum]
MSKNVLITGGTGGIGFSVAQTLGKAGFTVLINDINEKVGKEKEAELRAQGINAEFFLFDATNEDEINKAFEEISNKYGSLEALINGAGGLGGRSQFEGMKTEFFRSVMALNFDSVVFVTRAAIPLLKKGVNPSIINFTSIAGWNAGGPGAGIYAASKAAVTTLTRAYAKELAEFNIRANAVSPGTIDTPFHQATKVANPALFESWKQGILMKRFGQPEEVASVVEFLISDKASFLTGEIIQINGGQAFI